MKLKIILSRLLIVSLSLTVFSCANVPDVPLCVEINPDKGWCSYTLKQGGFYVDESRPYQFNPREFDAQGKPILYTWWEYRPYMIQVPPHSWEEIKNYLIKQCKKSQKCKDGVGEWFNEFYKVKQ